MVSARKAVTRAGSALFGQPLVTNTVRGVLVEAMIAEALEPDWKWCAADYAAWDFERGSQRLEVKQSASLQSWNAQSGKVSTCSFDIAYRSQLWIDQVWIKSRQRAAHAYIFAHHALTTCEADHREPDQWDFYVVPTAALPETRRISLGHLRTLCSPVRLSDLKHATNTVLPIEAS